MYVLSCAVPQKDFSNITPDGFALSFLRQVQVTSLSAIKSHTYITVSFYVTVIILLQVTMVLILSV